MCTNMNDLYGCDVNKGADALLPVSGTLSLFDFIFPGGRVIDPCDSVTRFYHTRKHPRNPLHTNKKSVADTRETGFKIRQINIIQLTYSSYPHVHLEN